MTASPTPRRAIVIGASMAGLLAARVLHEHYPEVVLLERDDPPDTPAPRKGTPHAVHTHGLLARGRQILDELFPGFTAGLVAQGAVTGDIGTSGVLQCDRRRFAARALGEHGLCASRLLIEADVRRRVRTLPGVTMVGDAEVVAPVHRDGRVSGVRWHRRDQESAPELLDAELVVDCSGRASRTPTWLREWGYDAPAEDRVTVHLQYATAYFERDPAADLPRFIICTASPELPRPGVLLAQEPSDGGPPRWVMTLGGYGADAPQPSTAAMAARARSMGAPEMARLADDGRLLGTVLGYRFLHSQRRRYERLRRFPTGLLVLGDALTSFNPIYGQGMTVAACQADALRRMLQRQGQPAARRFFAAAAKVIDTPWQLAVGADLALPCVEGPKPAPVRLVNAYVARLMRAAVRDTEVAAAFTRVMHLLAPPATLFAPRIAWRVCRQGAGLPAAAGAGEPRAAARQAR